MTGSKALWLCQWGSGLRLLHRGLLVRRWAEHCVSRAFAAGAGQAPARGGDCASGKLCRPAQAPPNLADFATWVARIVGLTLR